MSPTGSSDNVECSPLAPLGMTPLYGSPLVPPTMLGQSDTPLVPPRRKQHLFRTGIRYMLLISLRLVSCSFLMHTNDSSSLFPNMLIWSKQARKWIIHDRATYSISGLLHPFNIYYHKSEHKHNEITSLMEIRVMNPANIHR